MSAHQPPTHENPTSASPTSASPTTQRSPEADPEAHGSPSSRHPALQPAPVAERSTSFPGPATLWVEAWPDPVIDQLGHDPRSRYVERFWLGVVGPSTTWLVRHLADELDRSPGGYPLDLAHTAGALGLGNKGGRNSPFMRSIDRAVQFGMAQRAGDVLRVRRNIAPLTQGQVQRLPADLQAAHRQHQERQLQPAAADLTDQEVKARRLALTLLEIGEDYDAAERQLERWNHTGPVAVRALRWAQQRHRAAQVAAIAQQAPAPQREADDAA